ncbi:hypothetical protein evm_012810 [Chilo suppressalis]|nr:hypothetical protein evm_012810 [Chilo suppressalis]
MCEVVSISQSISVVVCVGVLSEDSGLSRCGACAFFKLTFIASAVGWAIAVVVSGLCGCGGGSSGAGGGGRWRPVGTPATRRTAAAAGAARSASGRTPVPPPRRRWVPPSITATPRCARRRCQTRHHIPEGSRYPQQTHTGKVPKAER